MNSLLRSIDRCAVQGSARPKSHSGLRKETVAPVEAKKRCQRPALILMAHFENGSASLNIVEPARTSSTACGGPIQISARVKRKASQRKCPVRATGEIVQHGESLSLRWLARDRRKYAKECYGDCRRACRGKLNRGCHDAPLRLAGPNWRLKYLGYRGKSTAAIRRLHSKPEPTTSDQAVGPQDISFQSLATARKP